MSTYYSDNSERLSLNPAGDLPIRNSQRGALHALAAHFSLKTTPAIVALPTGVGKTVVAAATPYLLGLPGRALVVVPSKVLREQTSSELASQSQLFRYQVLADGAAPRVRDLSSRVDDWASVEDADMVVSLPTCVSPDQHVAAGKPSPPSDFFSLVVVDEAHHVPARTWLSLVEHFSDARHVFLTATPFRRDKRPIPGELVYHYPLGQAVSDGAYARVNFLGVPAAGLTLAERDVAIRDRALGRLADPVHEQSRLLIRAETIVRTKELADLYAQAGADIEVVHSNLTPRTVRQRLDRVREGEATGVAFVGILGEGFDCPNLKVGALHDKHKSLPVTLQFIGRLTRRAPGLASEAEVVATYDDLKASTWELWRHSAVWDDLIPGLADRAVEAVAERRALMDRMPEFDNPEVSRLDLQPRRQATVYEHRHDGEWAITVDDDFLAVAGLQKADPWALGQIVYSAALPDQRLVVLVTAHREHPRWMTSPALDAVVYELHLVAVEPDPPLGSTFLFVISNTRRNERALAELVARTDDIVLADSEAIVRYAQSVEMRSLHNLGLRATSGRGRGLRAYTNVAGSNVDRSVLDSDRRGNHLGHGMGVGERLPGDRRGAVTFSVGKGRINETPTGDLAEYLQWVRAVSRLMRGNAEADHLDLVPGLAIEQRADAWPVSTKILWVDPDHQDAEHWEVVGHGDVRLLVLTAQANPADQVRLISIEGHIEGDLCIQGELRPDGFFDNVTEDAEVSGPATMRLSEYLEEHTPRIYFADGSSMSGGFRTAGGPDLLSLPPGLVRGLAWCNVDITSETTTSEKGRSIHSYVAHLLTRLHPRAWIVQDDGSGELADHVAIDSTDDGRTATITLVHSKYSSEGDPGLRVEDFDVLLGQAVRSRRWVQDGPFFWGELARRLRTRASTKVLSTGSSDAHSLLQACDRWQVSPPIPNVHIVAAQPGFEVAKLARALENSNPGAQGRAIAESLHAANTWITTGSISFSVLGMRR